MGKIESQIQNQFLIWIFQSNEYRTILLPDEELFLRESSDLDHVRQPFDRLSVAAVSSKEDVRNQDDVDLGVHGKN